MGREMKGKRTRKGHFSHVGHGKHSCSGANTELESSGVWSGQECWSEVDKCFPTGQPTGSIKSCHGVRHMFTKPWPFPSCFKGTLWSRVLAHGGINTTTGFWKGKSSTVFLLPLSLFHWTTQQIHPHPHTSHGVPLWLRVWVQDGNIGLIIMDCLFPLVNFAFWCY